MVSSVDVRQRCHHVGALCGIVTDFSLVEGKGGWQSFSSACGGGFALFLSHTRALCNSNLSDLELLIPVINSYF